jgi:hypothetical protein
VLDQGLEGYLAAARLQLEQDHGRIDHPSQPSQHPLLIPGRLIKIVHLGLPGLRSHHYDPEAHNARKHTTPRVGDKVHITETRENDLPYLITNIDTTIGPAADGAVIPDRARGTAATRLTPWYASRGYRLVGCRMAGRESG